MQFLKPQGFWAGVALALFLSGGLFVYWTGANPQDQQKFVKITEQALIASAPIPDQMSFAGEALPPLNFDLRERMDRELSITRNMHASTSLSLKRGARYKDEILAILRQEGVPDDFFYLMLAESGADVVTSPAAAQGFWQFIPSTARMYGLEISDAVDERNDLTKSTRAACRYLKASYKKFGSWTLAAAAYNCGDGAVNWVINQQGTRNFWELYLNLETSRYLFRILSFKLIEQNPELYGFKFYPGDLYTPIPHKLVTVDSAVTNLVGFARQQGISYRMLKVMNPWLLKAYLPRPVGKVWTLRIPTEEALRAPAAPQQGGQG